MKLLIVEDNLSLVTNLFEYFEARGHVLDATPDGITGLHLAINNSHDAIVLDWTLPRLQGPDHVRGLRNETSQNTPALMRASPAVVSRESLEHTLWGDSPPNADLLRSHIYELRRAVDGEHAVKLIHTVPRVGYRLGPADTNE